MTLAAKISAKMSAIVHKLAVSDKEKEPLVFSNPRNIATLPKLPLWRKLGFAVGSMPYTLCNSVIGYYLTFFLLEVALLDPTWVLLIVLLGRVWDGISDPICGYLCSRTKTKLGQFRPWILLSALPTAIVYFLLWFVPNFNSETLKFLYYLAMYLLLQTMLTCVHVPYTSLTVHLSYDQKEIDSVTAYRVVFEMIGTLIGVAIYTASFTIFARQPQVCDEERTRDIHKERAFRYHALVIGVLIVVLLLITFFTVKEQKEMIDQKTKVSVIDALKEIWGFRPYRNLFFVEMFAWLAVQFGQGNLAFYVKYALGMSAQLPYIIFVFLILNILWLPLWQFVLVRIGKKTTFVVGAWILMPAGLSLLFIDYYPNLIWPLGIAIGGGVGTAYLLPWSMIPDVVDAASLKKGVRREEFFYSFFVFGNKFSSGVTLAVSTGLYKLAGYDQLACDQPWSVPLLFKILVSCPPILFTLLSLFCLWRYPINEERRKEIKERLKTKRRSIPSDVWGQNDAEDDSRIVQDTSYSYNTPNKSTDSSGNHIHSEHTSDENTLKGAVHIHNNNNNNN